MTIQVLNCGSGGMWASCWRTKWSPHILLTSARSPFLFLNILNVIFHIYFRIFADKNNSNFPHHRNSNCHHNYPRKMRLLLSGVTSLLILEVGTQLSSHNKQTIKVLTLKYFSYENQILLTWSGNRSSKVNGRSLRFFRLMVVFRQHLTTEILQIQVVFHNTADSWSWQLSVLSNLPWALMSATFIFVADHKTRRERCFRAIRALNSFHFNCSFRSALLMMS